jgi:hypothetical protein
VANDPFLEIFPVRNELDAIKDSIGSAVRVRKGTVVYRKGADEKKKAAFRTRWQSLFVRNPKAMHGLRSLYPTCNIAKPSGEFVTAEKRIW